MADVAEASPDLLKRLGNVSIDKDGNIVPGSCSPEQISAFRKAGLVPSHYKKKSSVSVADLSKIDPVLAGKLARYSQDGELDIEQLERQGLLNRDEAQSMRAA